MNRKKPNGRRAYPYVLKELREEEAWISNDRYGNQVISDEGRLPLEVLETEPAIFQPRDRDWGVIDDNTHIEGLKRAIERGPEHHLDPIVVWWSGMRWIVVDGHHRLEAYKQAERRPEFIPVVEFVGGLDEARMKSTADNHKNKLPMTTEERTEAAWRLTCTSELSKNDISKACGVSPRTIANMRSRIREVLSVYPDLYSPEKLSMENWKDVRQPEFLGENPEKPDPEIATEIRAKNYAKKLSRHLSDKPKVDPEGFALALVMLGEDVPERLIGTNAWSGYTDDPEGELMDDWVCMSFMCILHTLDR